MYRGIEGIYMGNPDKALLRQSSVRRMESVTTMYSQLFKALSMIDIY
jgi:hypothetical protein